MSCAAAPSDDPPTITLAVCCCRDVFSDIVEEEFVLLDDIAESGVATHVNDAVVQAQTPITKIRRRDSCGIEHVVE